jgi:hypothetical protein
VIKSQQVQTALGNDWSIWLGRIWQLSLWLMVVSCQKAEVPNPAETSCANLQGKWRLRQVSCAGSVQASTPAVTLEFLENQRVNQVNGASVCQSVYTWQYVLGATQPTFDFLSESNLQCRSSGAAANDCSGSGTSCDSATDFIGIANTFASCFIRGGEVYLRRTVTVLNNPDSLSYCEDGQSEQLIFASLESSSGGSYPGTGGTCADRLNPNESCLLTLEFSPLNVGSFNGRFEVLYDTGLEIRSSGRNLFGRGQ